VGKRPSKPPPSAPRKTPPKKPAPPKARPLDTLTPAYRRRIERALAQGKTRQEARGHHAGEARERREREREERGIASSDRKSIEAWFRRWNTGEKKELQLEELLEWVSENGYPAFQNYRDTWNAARRTYIAEMKGGVWASRGLGYLESLADTAGVPDASWMYYH
jgi:hypothetical protein